MILHMVQSSFWWDDATWRNLIVFLDKLKCTGFYYPLNHYPWRYPTNAFINSVCLIHLTRQYNRIINFILTNSQFKRCHQIFVCNVFCIDEKDFRHRIRVPKFQSYPMPSSDVFSYYWLAIKTVCSKVVLIKATFCCWKFDGFGFSKIG